MRGRLVQFFGDISYSIYLLHMLIYLKVFPIVMRVLPGTIGITVSIILSLGLTVAAAYGLYCLVEVPAQTWSSSVRYARPPLARDKEQEQAEVNCSERHKIGTGPVCPNP